MENDEINKRVQKIRQSLCDNRLIFKRELSRVNLIAELLEKALDKHDFMKAGQIMLKNDDLINFYEILTYIHEEVKYAIKEVEYFKSELNDAQIDLYKAICNK